MIIGCTVMHTELNKFLWPQTYQNTRLNVEQALTLPPEIYRSENFHSIEAEKIFGHSWVCVGYTCQVKEPGQMMMAKVANQPIVITRDKQGNLQGFYNVCRHRGSLLVTKEEKLERFRCPYHSWT